MISEFHQFEEIIRPGDLELINADFRCWNNIEAWSEIVAILKLDKDNYVSILFPTSRN
jgi:hypothetical protein